MHHISDTPAAVPAALWWPVLFILLAVITWTLVLSAIRRSLSVREIVPGREADRSFTPAASSDTGGRHDA